MNKIKAVIFDMDGVVVDDFGPWLEFDQKFSAHFGFTIDDDYIRYVNGRSEEETVKWVKEHFALAESEEDIMAYRRQESEAIYRIQARPMAGAENLLKTIKKYDLILALCSGATMWQIEIILKRFNWSSYFNVIVSSDHVGYKGKPDPEIYLYTSKLLKIKPEDCVVIEDAENGVKAAQQADMRCIGYKDLRFNIPDNLSKAVMVVNSLSDQKIIDFLQI